ATAVVTDAAELAVHGHGRTHDAPSEGLSNRLMAKTHAEQRHPARGSLDQLEADSRTIGIAGTRRNNNAFRLEIERFRHADPVISRDENFRPELANEVLQVVDETIVIIDQQEHESARSHPSRKSEFSRGSSR